MDISEIFDKIKDELNKMTTVEVAYIINQFYIFKRPIMGYPEQGDEPELWLSANRDINREELYSGLLEYLSSSDGLVVGDLASLLHPNNEFDYIGDGAWLFSECKENQPVRLSCQMDIISIVDKIKNKLDAMSPVEVSHIINQFEVLNSPITSFANKHPELNQTTWLFDSETINRQELYQKISDSLSSSDGLVAEDLATALYPNDTIDYLGDGLWKWTGLEILNSDIGM